MQIDIPLTKPQREFVLCQEPYPAMVAGLGAGKTHAATVRFLLQMMQERGINTLLGMPTYDLLRMRAIPGFEEVLLNIGVPFKTNKSEYFIDVMGFGKIYFRSYDRPERWVAFEVAKTLLDELDTLPKEKAELVWRKASERTRQKSLSGNSIGVVTTPDQGINGFVYQKWVKEKVSGYVVIKASTLSNPYLPDSYVEQIRNNYDSTLAELYIQGEFVSLSHNKVYHFYNRERHFSDRVVQDGDLLHVGQDFNIGGCCSTVWVIDNGMPIAVDEFVSHDTQDICNNLANKYPKNKIIVYPDASGGSSRTNATQSDIDIIENNGYAVDCDNQNPSVRDRINCINALLCHDKIRVNYNKCPELAHGLETQGYTDKHEPEKFNDHPAIDDWNDSAGYFIYRRFPIHRPSSGVSWA